MSPRRRTGRKLLVSLLPIILVLALALVGLTVWLVYGATHPPRRAYLVTPEKFVQLSDRGLKATEETWSNRDGTSARGWLVRGAEGDYVRWLKAAKGPYDGFLLSTANCFAREFHQIVEDLAARRVKAAHAISERLTGCINEVFGIVTGLPHGNPFANANKAMDHFFAHGPRAQAARPPRLHAGTFLPADVIRATGEALSRHGLMPNKGYLE